MGVDGTPRKRTRADDDATPPGTPVKRESLGSCAGADEDLDLTVLSDDVKDAEDSKEVKEASVDVDMKPALAEAAPVASI